MIWGVKGGGPMYAAISPHGLGACERIPLIIVCWPSPQMATSIGRDQTFPGGLPPPRPPSLPGGAPPPQTPRTRRRRRQWGSQKWGGGGRRPPPPPIAGPPPLAPEAPGPGGLGGECPAGRQISRPFPSAVLVAQVDSQSSYGIDFWCPEVSGSYSQLTPMQSGL